LLIEESTLLAERRYGELSRLHEEKVSLSKQLESFQTMIEKNPALVKEAEPNAREELILLTDELAQQVQDNFRQVAAAKAVNHRVMQAIMDVLSDDQRALTYTRDGMAHSANDLALSINLNQKA
jgi:flagellar biosynthesis/type III secretory pathway chaperone